MIIQANALHLPLKDNTVQCCVTSPPYYGLRDYGTAKWEGGDVNCDHLGKPVPTRAGFNERYFGRESSENNKQDALRTPYKDICGKCGAIRIDDQIGLEPTPDEYVAKLVQVFREVKRVLKDDGVLWLNLGDSYAGSGKGPAGNLGATYNEREIKQSSGIIPDGCKPKDLIGIPWMVAFALRADGWYLRSDIIWSKPNPMPESVKDRPTKAHEYLFLLAKSQKYYYDADAVREPLQAVSIERAKHGWHGRGINDTGNYGGLTHTDKMGDRFAPENGRNKRTVWEVNTSGFDGAHFAVMPEKLVEPCVLAGTSEYGQCPKCGANWVRVVEKEKPPADVYAKNGKPESIVAISHPELGKVAMGQKLQDWYNEHPSKTTGWQPTCGCNAGREPNIVLDPFAGSGTVGVVAQKFGRQFIGIELNPEYVKLAEKRLIATPQSLFNQSILQETL